MSMNQATLEGRNFDIITKGLAVHVATLKAKFGFQSSTEQAEAAPSNVVNARGFQGLAALVGKYDNDPSWDDFPAFLEQYRREIDEMNRD